MMGLLLQRVGVAVLLAVTLLLANPPLITPPFVTVATAAEDTKSDSEKKSKGTEETKVDGVEDKKESKDEDAELPPLDLGTGTTATEKPATEDVLAEGVTATAKPKGNETQASKAPPTPETGSDVLDPKKLWTPNSGRFLLKDRQAGLALASSADTEDKGDGKSPKPVVKKPVVVSAPASTSYGFPTEATSPKDESFPVVVETSPTIIDLPQFISDNQDPLDTPESEVDPLDVDDFDSQIEDQEPEDSTSGSSLVFGRNDDETAGDENSGEIDIVGVIRPNSGEPETLNSSPGNNSIFGSNEELGESIVGVSPWRGLGVFLLCLGLIFAAYWASQKFKGKLGGLPGKTLSVIETIGIGAGRQIIIIEMNNDALILGVTPNSINLLDKVPLTTLNSGYSETVDGIISREGNALPEQWESRPRFDTALETPILAPPIQTGTYGPAGKSTQSVAELRRTRQAPATTGSFAQVAEPPPPKNPKDELLGRFRSQLNRFEE